MIELGLRQDVNMEDDILDERCYGCPAILAGEFIGAARMAKTVCAFAFVPPVRDSDEVGCRKGPVEEGKIFVPVSRPEPANIYQVSEWPGPEI